MNIDNTGSSKRKLVGHYQLKNRIGIGAYAEVFLATDIRSNQDVAVKVIARDKIQHTKLQENLQSEIAILRDYNHPNIVRLCDHFNSTKYIFLILELCEGGDLSKYIKKYKNVSESISIKFLKQIASGLSFLNQKSLIHRDLKPANILLTECSENAILKLADFGFAKELKDAASMMTTRCGTPLYMSPEVLDSLEYNAKVDIWSCGCIFYEMIVGSPPFKGANEVDLLKNIKTMPLSLPSHIELSKKSITLLKGLLERNPIRRISLESFNQVLDTFSEECMKTSNVLSSDISSKMTTDINRNDINVSTSVQYAGSKKKTFYFDVSDIRVQRCQIVIFTLSSTIVDS
jgi:serine/threonine-protein kinase ULK/ATG1